MENQIELHEQLMNDIVKMLVDYDDYVEDKHIYLIVAARNIVKGTPMEFKYKPDNILKEYWKYQTNPMINSIANKIVGYIMTEIQSKGEDLDL